MKLGCQFKDQPSVEKLILTEINTILNLMPLSVDYSKNSLNSLPVITQSLIVNFVKK